jgi:hypothetical protein
VDPGDAVYYCLLDCTEGPAGCPSGTTCDAVGNCVPDDASCAGDTASCSPAAPYGSCPSGETCAGGECVARGSSQCAFGLTDDSGAAQIVERGQILARRYNETLAAYWSDDGSNPTREDRLFREFSRAEWELENHITKINDIRAVYSVFGKIF